MKVTVMPHRKRQEMPLVMHSAVLMDLDKWESTTSTLAHQNMGLSRLLQTLEFVKKNISGLMTEVVAGSWQRSTRICFKAILKIPNVGEFFAWQILTDLLECWVLGGYTDNQWTCLGLGAKNGLRRIFQLDSSQGELRHSQLHRDLCNLESPPHKRGCRGVVVVMRGLTEGTDSWAGPVALIAGSSVAVIFSRSSSSWPANFL